MAPEIETDYCIVVACVSRQDDDRILKSFIAQMLNSLPAVHVRKADVHDHQIGSLFASDAESFRAARSLQGAELLM